MNRINMSAPDAEYAQIQEAAHLLGMSNSAFVLQGALAHANLVLSGADAMRDRMQTTVRTLQDQNVELLAQNTAGKRLGR